MDIVQRLKIAIAGFASGIVCGIAAGISVCVFGGMILPKLAPDLAQLASADLFVHIAFGFALGGMVTGLIGSRVFDAYSALSWAGPLSLLFGIAGLFVGAFGGPLLRIALEGFGHHSSGEHLIERDIRVGCGLGMVFGVLSAIRLWIWPPQWMWWRHT